MSSDESGSDLDVFDDLKAKAEKPDDKASADPSDTLMGLRVPDSSLPPVPATGSTPPKPPSRRGAGPSGSSLHNPDKTPVTPPSAASLSRAGLGAVESLASEDFQPEDTSPELGAAPWQEGEERQESPSRPPVAPPPGAAGLSLDSWATEQPSSSVSSPRISVAPPVAPESVSVASAAAPAAASSPPNDVGWDDDDDKTTIYDKDTQAAAQSLLQPSGGAQRPPPPMSRPPAAMMQPVSANVMGRTTAPPSPHEASFSMPPPRGSTQRVLPYLLAVVGAGVVGVLVLLILPKKGALTVTVAGGPGNKPLAAVEVVVDDRLRCRESPCELTGLKPGTHYVEVRASGYQGTAKSAVAVVGAQTAVHNVQLIRAGTGIKVFGEGAGLQLSVDGQAFGPLPQELRQMEPGEHVVQVAGGPRYEVFQQRIVVDPGRMTPIGPIKLKVIEGLATIKAGANAEGAEVMLKVGDSRRMLPALPVRLEVETKRSHVLVAKRKGFVSFEQPIVFEDGQAEKTITVNLSERHSPRPAAPVVAVARPPARSIAKATPRTESPSRAPVPATESRITLRSSPPSNVVLDGRPLGHTPHDGIEIKPGKHRVIFIRGRERKLKMIDVPAGESRTVSVSF